MEIPNPESGIPDPGQTYRTLEFLWHWHLIELLSPIFNYCIVFALFLAGATWPQVTSNIPN